GFGDRRGPALLAIQAAIDLADRYLGDAEVEHLDEVGIAGPIDQHHIFGLEVAVDDAECVSAAERAGNLAVNVQRPRLRERAERDLVAKIFALYELEDQKHRAVGEFSEVG